MNAEKPIENISFKDNKKSMVIGQKIILYMGILTFIYYFLGYLFLNEDLANIKKQDDLVVDENIVINERMNQLIILGLGIFYIFLYLWSLRTALIPLWITLIVYLADTGYFLYQNSSPNTIALLVRVAILFFLVKAIVAINKLKNQLNYW